MVPERLSSTSSLALCPGNGDLEGGWLLGLALPAANMESDTELVRARRGILGIVSPSSDGLDWCLRKECRFTCGLRGILNDGIDGRDNRTCSCAFSGARSCSCSVSRDDRREMFACSLKDAARLRLPSEDSLPVRLALRSLTNEGDLETTSCTTLSAMDSLSSALGCDCGVSGRLSLCFVNLEGSNVAAGASLTDDCS